MKKELTWKEHIDRCSAMDISKKAYFEENNFCIPLVDSKISKIKFLSSSGKDNLKFEYDAMGNRVAKYVMQGQTEFPKHVTFYVRDASGIVMAVYEHDLEIPESYHLSERHIYGSSRIGMVTKKVELNYTYSNNTSVAIDQEPLAVLDRVDVVFTTSLGYKQYELTNHLGNVLAVIGDQKLPVLQGGVLVSFEAHVISSQDYSPFSVTLSGRSWSAGYRYGFNGKERDDKTFDGAYDFGARILDTRLGRWMSVDPMFHYYPSLNPYMSMNNSPVLIIDPSGRGGIVSNITRGADGHYYGTLTFNVFLYSDEVPTDQMSQSLVSSGLGDGFSFMNEGYMLAYYNNEQVTVYLNLEVNIEVISAEDAQMMIENETQQSNNYFYVNTTTSDGSPAEYFGGNNYNGKNQGSIANRTFSDERAPGLLVHELWHSVARYFCTRPDCGGSWLYGEHNESEPWSLMQGSGLQSGDYLTQQDLFATGLYEPRFSIYGTTNYPSFSITKDVNGNFRGAEIGGGVCNEFMIDDSGEKCQLMSEGGCDESDNVCPQ